MHWWPRLPAAVRLRLSVATSAAGIGFLVAAVEAEGQRESALTSMVLVGPTTLTATASASASLYYYVLTAVCLLLGFAGLAFGETLSRWLAPRPLLGAVAVAWLMTLVRFLLEKSAAPALLVQAIGVTWIAPVAGACLATGTSARPAGKPLLKALVSYALLVRGFVAVVSLVATRFGLGSHYDVSEITRVFVSLTGEAYSLVPGTWRHSSWLILVPQLLVWPVFTVVAGMAGAAVARFLPPSPRSTVRPTLGGADAAPVPGRDQDDASADTAAGAGAGAAAPANVVERRALCPDASVRAAHGRISGAARRLV